MCEVLAEEKVQDGSTYRKKGPLSVDDGQEYEVLRAERLP